MEWLDWELINSPFTWSGAIVLLYALSLIHRRVQIGVGQAVLVIAAVVILLVPFLVIKVGTDGSIEVKRIDALGDATQQTVQGLADLDTRLKELAVATEKRLAALEQATSAPPPEVNARPLDELVTPETELPVFNNKGESVLENLHDRGFPRLPIF